MSSDEILRYRRVGLGLLAISFEAELETSQIFNINFFGMFIYLLNKKS